MMLRSQMTTVRERCVASVYSSGFKPGIRVPPLVQKNILGDSRKHLTSIKTKHRNRVDLEPTLILALTMIRLRIEVLACQKQAHRLINRPEPL
jgi:hypothetical protein